MSLFTSRPIHLSGFTVIFLFTLLHASNAYAKPRKHKTYKGHYQPSKEKLVRRALAFIKQGDARSYIKLTMRISDAKKYCHGIPADKLKRIEKEVREDVKKSIEKCSQLIDWKRAKEVRFVDDRRRSSIDVCQASVKELGDFIAIYEVDGKTYKVKIDDPVELTKSKFLLADAPYCYEETE